LAASEPLYFAAQGAGPPLVLLHGLMVTGEMFEPVVGPFATRHRVIVPDLRGHGRSRNLPPPYTAAQLASDLARLLDRLGIHSTAVLGYSHGGAIAQQFALDHPGRCSRLVLACTYAYNMTTLREMLEGHLVPLLIRVLGMRRFAKFVVSLGARDLGKERGDWMVGLMADQEERLMLSAWKEAMAFDARRRLRDVACPTLVVAGSNDRAVPLHHANALHDGIAGSRLVVIDRAGHTLIWTQPDALVRITEEFLGA
jgi:pimeloyl-ACP methyl ester carboxylesterase